MLVFGSVIGEGNYTRSTGEIIWFEESDFYMNSYLNTTLTTNAEVILTQESNGKIPKGVKAIYGRVSGKHSGTGEYLQLAPNNGSLATVSCTSQVSGVAMEAYGWCPCNAKGNVWIRKGATINNTYFKVMGVELK